MFDRVSSLMAAERLPSVNRTESVFPPPLRIPVMSFNIRLDCLESDDRNHFLRRLPRIARLFQRAAPWTVGMQEAFSGQLTHTLSVLDPKYKAVTYRRPPGQPVHDSDAKVAIVYDSTRLQLMEQDYLWLSETPKVEGTDFPHDDSSMRFDPRCLNIARFRINQSGGGGAEHTDAVEPLELIHFNTHLSVFSESSRRRGSALAASVVREWRARYPRALFVFTGDFNTAPGQSAHRTLTGPGMLADSFSECAATGDCATSSVANSFHGWRGTQPNGYLFRAAQVVLFTLYGAGLKIPTHMPHTPREVWAALKQLWADLSAPRFPLREALPLWPFDRFHVDWILYAKEPHDAAVAEGNAEEKPADRKAAEEPAVEDAGSDGWQRVDRPADASDSAVAAGAVVPQPRPAAPTPSMRPILSTLLDVRSSDYSSDHFPIVTVFEVKRNG